MESPTPHAPAQRAPFDRRLSLRLDGLIVALESAPPWNRRAWLHTVKRIAERHVPAFGRRAA
jgi:hypothetical protein